MSRVNCDKTVQDVPVFRRISALLSLLASMCQHDLAVCFSINVHELTSLNLVLRTTIMTPIKLQISKFQPEKSCHVGFIVLQRLYSRAFVTGVKSSVLDSVLSVCICITTVQIFSSNVLKRKYSALNAFYNFQAGRDEGKTRNNKFVN
jgi:hypothetical protein